MSQRSSRISSGKRRLAHASVVAWLALAQACSRPVGSEREALDHPPSPQAQIMPAPLAPAQAAESAQVAPDAGPPAVPLRTYDELSDTAPAKDPPVHTLDLVFRQGDLPGFAKGPDVNVPGLEAARKKTELRAKLEASPNRMRMVLEGAGFVLPNDVELRSRADRLGHVAVAGAKYRVLPPGTMRAFFAERRLDVGPLDHAEVLVKGEGPRRLGLRTRRVELVARSSKVTVDLAHVADAGEGGVLLCRFLLDLASALPRTPLCGPEEVPLFAEYRWSTRGTFVVEVLSFARRTDVSSAQMLVPPVGSMRADELFPRERAGRMLGPPELRALRHGDPTSMSELEVTNPTTALSVVWIDGVPAAWLGASGQLTLFGLAPGKYQVAWRSTFGDLTAPTEVVTAPGRVAWGISPDAGK
jgi:hypothetical protein